MGRRPVDLDRLRVKPGEAPQLEARGPADTQGMERRHAKQELAAVQQQMAELQDALFAEHTRAVLLILQGLDASGKDSAIKDALAGINPQGISVARFGPPSDEELDHDYLWRSVWALPPRGSIGVFNRSYYEEHGHRVPRRGTSFRATTSGLRVSRWRRSWPRRSGG